MLLRIAPVSAPNCNCHIHFSLLLNHLFKKDIIKAVTKDKSVAFVQGASIILNLCRKYVYPLVFPRVHSTSDERRLNIHIYTVTRRTNF